MRPFIPIKVPERGSPFTREVFELINRERIYLGEVARRSGLSTATIVKWRVRSGLIDNIAAVLDTLGYELMILPKARPFNED